MILSLIFKINVEIFLNQYATSPIMTLYPPTNKYATLLHPDKLVLDPSFVEAFQERNHECRVLLLSAYQEPLRYTAVLDKAYLDSQYPNPHFGDELRERGVDPTSTKIGYVRDGMLLVPRGFLNTFSRQKRVITVGVEDLFEIWNEVDFRAFKASTSLGDIGQLCRKYGV